MRTETIKWQTFFANDHKQENKLGAGIVSGATIWLAAAPSKSVLAASEAANDSWSQVWVSALQISDWLCVGVITFAGATWMFGNRTRALEMLIGAASGYLIIRHAMDIKDWLASI